MNKKQYNNIIKNTLKRVHTEDSLSAARAVFKNMGVALPGGDIKEVFETVKTDNYMGWKSCTMEEAQAAANNGTAAIGISDSKIVVLAADDAEEPIEPTAEVLAITDSTPAVAVAGLQYYSYSYGTTNCPYVDIPQNGNIGTVISYMGYHLITSTSSAQYKLKHHAQNNHRYSYSYPEYYAQIDGRIVIATKPNIGNQLPLSIGDYVQVKFKTDSGYIRNYECIIGDFKGADAPNIWGHYDGQGVVEVVYHNYNPPSGYYANANNPWGSGRVIRVTKVGNYGNFA